MVPSVPFAPASIQLHRPSRILPGSPDHPHGENSLSGKPLLGEPKECHTQVFRRFLVVRRQYWLILRPGLEVFTFPVRLETKNRLLIDCFLFGFSGSAFGLNGRLISASAVASAPAFCSGVAACHVSASRWIEILIRLFHCHGFPPPPTIIPAPRFTFSEPPGR